MAFGLMKAANLPIYIGYAAVVAVPPIVSFTLPGVTAMPNVLPTSFLGTTTWAAPGLSIAISVLGILLAVFYLRYLIKQARRKGIGRYSNTSILESDCADHSCYRTDKFLPACDAYRCS